MAQLPYWHTKYIRKRLFRSPPQPMWDITIHLHSRPNVLAGTHSFFRLMWNPHQIHLLRGPASLLAHRLMFTPFKENPPRWHIVRCLADTICNGPGPPLAILFSLSFLFRAFPQNFKTRVLGKGFHTLIKGVSFSFPTKVRYHIYNSYNLA